jgi:hypothetical protein
MDEVIEKVKATTHGEKTLIYLYVLLYFLIFHVQILHIHLIDVGFVEY